jgi:hypothetical protein
LLQLLVACAPIRGYRTSGNTDATFTAAALFQRDRGKDYLTTTRASPQRERNGIVLLAAWIRYRLLDFEKRLYGDANAVTLGSDLVGAGVGRPRQQPGMPPQNQLGAASARHRREIGDRRDLYYQKTIPALLAQMEADRLMQNFPAPA